ncbi:MAG: hypothetical protein QXT40_03670 [Candidatus Micrarchaeia archaeon]
MKMVKIREIEYENLVKNVRRLILILIISFLFSNSYAAELSIPYNVVSNPNVKVGELTIVSHQLRYGNPGSIPERITLSVTDNIKDFVHLSEREFELDAGESKNVTLYIILSDAISRSGKIIATANDGTISLSMETIVNINPNYLGNSNNSKAPSQPSIISPSNNERICRNYAILSWSQASDQDSSIIAYQYEISKYSDFSIILDKGIVPNTSIKIPISEGVKYYWRVRAYDGKYYSNWSSSSFKAETLWNCLEDTRSRLSFLENLVNLIKLAICSVHSFSICNSPITTTTTIPTTSTTTTSSTTTIQQTTTVPGQTTTTTISQSTTTTIPTNPTEIFITENWSVVCPSTFNYNGVTYTIINCRAELWRNSWYVSERIMQVGESWVVNRGAGYYIKLYGRVS